jgi:hypothetical protein
MNAQIYPFNPACQTECEGSQKNFSEEEQWNVGRMEKPAASYK